MNITELARILRITPQELRNNLPQFGFDIGQKAIKINKQVANKIIKDWPILRRKIEKQKEELELKKEKEKEQLMQNIKPVEIMNYITVRDFSNKTGLSINTIMSVLMKNGIFSSLNEKIDFDTAWLVASELGFEVVKTEKENETEGSGDDKIKKIIGNEKKENLMAKPPVIVVMGHVDHGKTRLLDAIRKTNVLEGEAGGITQHIGAYQVTRKNQVLTFIDTPGHEAFTAMRSRGAKIADIAILVVAADDGVKPQTTEAYRIIEAAKIPFVVAINKIDKPAANIDKTKQELSSQLNILPEDWGGKISCVPISAKDGTGIADLLDTVLLTSEVSDVDIVANPDSNAVCTVIDTNIDKGAGPVATILVQNGTLNIGDQVTLNNNIAGKIRGLLNYKGEAIVEAGPATPVQVIGLKTLPQVGDVLIVGEGERVKYKKTKHGSTSTQTAKSEQAKEDDKNAQKINLIIKSDVFGSAEAIEESLEKINTKDVRAKIIYKGLGNISDGDIKRAEACNGLIVGFNVKVPPNIEEIARDKNVEIKQFNIIYDLLNDVKERMQKIVVPTIERVDLGRIKVLAIFKTEKKSQIVGGKVLDGKIEDESKIEVLRDKELLATGKMLKLQAGKQDVHECEKDLECGILYEGDAIIQIGDILNIYKEKTVLNKI
jgi:translation initiation factor IF-2